MMIGIIVFIAPFFFLNRRGLFYRSVMINY